MILSKLVVENFRQFRGRQEIDFLDSSQPNRNVTVVFGENGRGKTGLFRAVVFCLFGDRKLSQDGEVAAKELQLANVSAMQDSAGEPVSTSVELEFWHGGQKLALKRAISAMVQDGTVLEEPAGVSLAVTGVDGNTEVVDPRAAQQRVNAILDPRVKDYFLFDGETIERLTRATLEQRREVSKGIRNLLNVDSLELGIKSLKRVTATLDQELSASSSAELVRLLARLDDNERNQASTKSDLDQLESESRLARQEIVDTDKELDKFGEIRHLVERRKSLEGDLRAREQEAAEARSEMRGFVVKATTLTLAPVVKQVFTHIDAQRQKGDIPSEIRRDLIDRILAEARCICGREMCRGSEEYSQILAWRERTLDDSMQNAALNLWRYLSDVSQHLSDDADAVERQLLQYANIRNSITTIQRELEQVRNQIGGGEREDASRLDVQRKNLENTVIELEARALAVQSNLSDLEREEERVKALLREEKLKVARSDELTRRSLLARDALDSLNNVHRQFTREVKADISRMASEYLSLLLDSEGRENLHTVVVSEDYSLQVLDRWKKPFLANISAGQRQVMSIAFIAALARKAARSDHIDMPLFMDTPFGRLSYQHRKNLVAQVPMFASQWILLATDTEFRRQEAELLRSGEKWARFFVLRPTSQGNTYLLNNPGEVG